MNSLSPHQSTLSWWVEVYTSFPQKIYYLAPFNSREEAKTSRGAHIEALYNNEARDIVALIK
ncbi:DUF1816 domain-containing protein [Phormidesmis priestleyi ULC007]|uniref:DUF1816 domain-containing protein n=1 Tax=Phormidesmis priestleyi ULC007 TaxID=1920490 RepID=A0A2T1D905_9CYAN|nr:DUF1816 domain-containing protein [Phormidesmis priestleyi]PSB16975.1 DUF1816 domain-containing protein [Phormidesmis priestleyi ULC007]PZO47916.1 MAG: DUF1816 domain-containing protein [Phormidesmis priestleyi]